MKLTWPAPAKINLFLQITNKRTDGFHDLQTIFQFLDWCDYLTFELNEEGDITLECDEPSLNDQKNIVIKAALLLQKTAKVKQGVHITLQKNIPSGAGLGGGSSNAATTIVALNYLWQCQLSQKQLQQLGTQLGADVPVFIFGQSCWAEGIGDKFSLLKAEDLPPEKNYYLIKPKQSINTAAIFSSALLKRDCKKHSANNIKYRLLKNVFEDVVANAYPEIISNISKQYNYLTEQGVDEKGHFLACDYRMTGSGSVFFIAIKDNVCAKQIKNNLPVGYSSKVSRSENESKLNKLIDKLNF